MYLVSVICFKNTAHGYYQVETLVQFLQHHLLQQINLQSFYLCSHSVLGCVILCVQTGRC